MVMAVKEEVIENYFYERRLVEEQLRFVSELAEEVAQLEERLSSRFARIYGCLSRPEFISAFSRLAGMPEALPESRLKMNPHFRNGLRLIRIRGVTKRTRFKKLILESYRRLVEWNEAYRAAYDDLIGECKAANANLKKFEDAYDLLTILNFLREMDIEEMERKRFLGDNFTPQELSSVETRLRLKPVRMEQFKLMPPPNLPEVSAIKRPLNRLADSVHAQCSDRLRSLIK
jgi:hypothetical protein